MTRTPLRSRLDRGKWFIGAAPLALGLVLLPLPLAAGTVPPACLPGTEQIFSPTGAVQTYDVPENAAEILVELSGAAGGDVIVGVPPAPDSPLGFGSQFGGYGIERAATVLIEGPLALSVVVGERGETVEGSPQAGEYAEGDGAMGAGGGGGSLVFDSAGALYIAAGGGGGAGVSEDGSDADPGETGVAGGGVYGGAGGSGGLGGAGGTFEFGANGSGGGGFLGAGGNGADGTSGVGGHQILPPGDAGGGAGVYGEGDGGFGGGGGGGLVGGGGGGGYSGGGGSYGKGVDGGGGGASYLSPSGSSLYLLTASDRVDGAVRICVTQVAGGVLAIPAISPAGFVALTALLGLVALVFIRRRRA